MDRGAPRLQKDKEVRSRQRRMVWTSGEGPVALLRNLLRQSPAWLGADPR